MEAPIDKSNSQSDFSDVGPNHMKSETKVKSPVHDPSQDSSTNTNIENIQNLPEEFSDNSTSYMNAHREEQPVPSATQYFGTHDSLVYNSVGAGQFVSTTESDCPPPFQHHPGFPTGYY